MIIGVTGDTHNNLKNIETICNIFNENEASLVLHTGDISLPKSLLAFKRLNCPLITVLGNNDIEEEKDLREAAKKFNCEIYNEPFSIEIAGKMLSLLHHPDLIDEDMNGTLSKEELVKACGEDEDVIEFVVKCPLQCINQIVAARLVVCYRSFQPTAPRFCRERT